MTEILRAIARRLGASVFNMAAHIKCEPPYYYLLACDPYGFNWASAF